MRRHVLMPYGPLLSLGRPGGHHMLMLVTGRNGILDHDRGLLVADHGHRQEQPDDQQRTQLAGNLSRQGHHPGPGSAPRSFPVYPRRCCSQVEPARPKGPFLQTEKAMAFAPIAFHAPTPGPVVGWALLVRNGVLIMPSAARRLTPSLRRRLPTSVTLCRSCHRCLSEGRGRRFAGAGGGSDEGGREELAEVWPRRASNSYTRSCRMAFSARRAALSRRSAATSSRSGAESGAGSIAHRSSTRGRVVWIMPRL
jgi:hypothetical protein